MRERQRKREREREREREKERERERERERETETDRQTEKQRETKWETETERQRQTEVEWKKLRLTKIFNPAQIVRWAQTKRHTGRNINRQSCQNIFYTQRLLARSGAGIMGADDRQVMTVFTIQPSFHHRHSTNWVSWSVTIVSERAVTSHLVVRRRW